MTSWLSALAGPRDDGEAADVGMVIDAVWIVVAAGIAAGVWWLAEMIQRIVVDRRAAARAALERDYEAHLIDAEALAKGLSALDEAA